uniref:Uncharacterized protein n=1 Tax=Utricularia reniformis TaxID=192314 RepID=A0A1Y0B1G4_9LAMI|nr:hypothetical protein AEK19_MT1074 [Utricularia reniformis]ART31296.1 hypothetical protein AEK19_MT1074 [Utricularia reniformis]
MGLARRFKCFYLHFYVYLLGLSKPTGWAIKGILPLIPPFLSCYIRS